MELSEREKEIIYVAISRLLEEHMGQKEFNEIDNLRDKFKQSD